MHKNCTTCGVELIPSVNWSVRVKGWQGYVCKHCDRTRRQVGNGERLRIQQRLGISQTVWTYEFTKERRKAEITYQRELDAANGITTVAPVTEGFQYDTTIQDEATEAAAILYRTADIVYNRIRSTAGYVYGIIHPNFVDMIKIGFTSNPTRRLGHANTWCPDKAYTLAFVIPVEGNAKKLETLVHRALARRGVRYLPNGEWFEINQYHAENLIERIKKEPTYL